jgi:hypothetical protein
MTQKNELLQELTRIQNKRRRGREKYFRPSRLDPYRTQIQILANAGGSREDIRIWLRQNAKVDVSGSTISRALQRWNAQNTLEINR